MHRIMLSEIEKDYVTNPKEFEETHKDSYVRKIRSRLRRKIALSVEDYVLIIKFVDSEYDRNKSLKGRERKSIMPLGSTFVLDDVLHWLESGLPSERKKWEEDLKRNLALTAYSTFKDTKIGKKIYKDVSVND